MRLLIVFPLLATIGAQLSGHWQWTSNMPSIHHSHVHSWPTNINSVHNTHQQWITDMQNKHRQWVQEQMDKFKQIGGSGCCVISGPAFSPNNADDENEEYARPENDQENIATLPPTNDKPVIRGGRQ